MTFTVDGLGALMVAVAIVFAGRLSYDLARILIVAAVVKSKKSGTGSDARPISVRLSEYRKARNDNR